MTEYVAPGVYIEEIERGPRPIEGVPTSVAAILGATGRGPLRPCMVTGFPEYLRTYGGFSGHESHVPFAVRGFFENGGKRLFVCRIASAAATTARADLGDYLLEAIGPGAWGNRIWIKLVGVRLRIACFAPGVAPYDCFDPANAANPDKPEVPEEYDDLDMNLHSEVILASSALVVLTRKEGAARDSLPGPFNGPLVGGADGNALDAADFRGSPSGERAPQGIKALESDACRDVALVAAPDADLEIQRALVAHCEASRFRMAILDSARGAAGAGLTPRADIADTSYAAFYSPWIEVADPATGARTFVPPCGHVLGIFARTDTERGVFKPPASEIVRGALGLEYAFDTDATDRVKPHGVNVIRAFPGRGILLWGARTLSSDMEWKYVSVRRLFMYLERSIYEAMQWVVFEPNGESLWARVRSMIEQFMYSQWRAGMFLGTKPEEAFFVKCDRTTMTQSDIDLGHLICYIGVAVLKPAEFQIIPIRQLTADSSRV